MEDRFKFRIWDKKLNKLSKWGDNPYHNMEIINYICVDKPVTEWKHDDYILMQCTGLKDKHNKLIYEGDIVKTKQTNPLQADKGVVQWHSGYFSIDFLELGKYGEAGISITKDTQDFMTIEVIGNIYENPELLERQK